MPMKNRNTSRSPRPWILSLAGAGNCLPTKISAQCMNNLKQVGLAVLMYADEKQEHFQISSPLDTKFSWGGQLSSNQNLGSVHEQSQAGRPGCLNVCR